MEEEAKAVQEVAKTAGKAIDASRELGGFLAKYVGGPMEQALGIVEDKLKYQRWERQVRLMDRAELFLSERGLNQPTRKLPLQLAIPLIQGGSLEENDSLQDKWAALLVNAADASMKIEIRRAFVSILEDLTPLDALVLEKIYVSQVSPKANEEIEEEVWTTFLPERVASAKPEQGNLRPSLEVEVSIGNLARLGLVTTASAWGGMAIFSCVHRTVLGREFMRACGHGGM